MRALYAMFYAWPLGLLGRGVSYQQSTGVWLKVRGVLAEGVGGLGERRGDDVWVERSGLTVNSCRFQQ